MELSPYRRFLMTEAEIKSLLSFKGQIIGVVDPLYIASQMVENGYISRDLHEAVQTKLLAGVKRRDIADFLISHLPFHTYFASVIRALHNCGYTKLASKLFLQFARSQTGIVVVKRIQYEKRIHLESFYKGLNDKIQDGQFKNPSEALDQLARRFISKFEVELNPREKSRIAEKCVAILGAQIVAHAITYGSALPRNEMFSQMKSLVPFTENFWATDVVYYVGKAYANLMTMNIEDGENMLKAARVRVYNTGPCAELINVLLMETYYLLCKYEISPTIKIKEDLLMWGNIGIESLEEEDDEMKIFWRRMFILPMVFCLLGIGNKASIIPGAYIDTNCIQMAKQLLADIDKHFEGIAQRREMFYRVARARLNQLLGRTDDALIHISLAENLAESGQFKEVFNIREIKSALQTIKKVRERKETMYHKNAEYIPSDFAGEAREANVCEPCNTSEENLQFSSEPAKYHANPGKAFTESSGNRIPLLHELIQSGENIAESQNTDTLEWISFSDQSESLPNHFLPQRMRTLQYQSNVPMTGEPTFVTLTDVHTDNSESVQVRINIPTFDADDLSDAEETKLKQPVSS